MIETIIQNVVDQLENWMLAIGHMGSLLIAIAILGASLFAVQILLQLIALVL